MEEADILMRLPHIIQHTAPVHICLLALPLRLLEQQTTLEHEALHFLVDCEQAGCLVKVSLQRVQMGRVGERDREGERGEEGKRKKVCVCVFV